MLSRFHTIFLLSFLCLGVQSQTKTSILSGTWNNPLIWTPLGVPSSTDNVLVNNGHTITLIGNGACNSLTLGTGTGGTATFQYTGNTARTLSVQNTFLINTNGSFLIPTTSNASHTLQLSGDLINNGSFDARSDNNSRCRVVFAKNGNQSISGTGPVCEFYQLVLNMGTSNTNILEVSTSVFIVPTVFLVLNNGTFKVSTPNAVSLVPYLTATTLPPSTGIWLNSATAVMSTSNSITLEGLIRLSSGTLNIGSGNNDDLIADLGTLNLSGGVLNIAGKLNASVAAINFSMSGGTIQLTTVQSNNTTVSPFHISAAGSQFNMSGGSIVINREGGTGNQNLGFVNTGSGSGSVTGGTLQFGSSSTPAAQIFRLISTFALPNILLNSANATVSVTTNSIQVNGNLAIASGTLNDNNLSIGVSGNWNNTGGSYLNSTNGTVIFNSASVGQTIFKTGGETFNHLVFSGSGLKTFASPVSAKGFSINSGASVDVSTSNHQLTVRNNFINNGSFVSRNGTVLLNGTVAQSIGGSSTSSFYDLSLNNTTGASLSVSSNLLNALTLSNGTFNTNGQVFTMVSTATASARVAQITGSGDIIGNVVVQRFAPGGSTGWAFLGAPISSALTLQDWDDDIYISCPGCPDGNAAGFLSIYTYNEAATGAVDAAAAYVPLSGITNPIVFGKGYWVYLGNGQFTTNDIVFDVTGTLRKFNQTIPLSYNNYGSVIDDGWNLIHNPYPSPISWTALRGSTSNVDNAIYVYNADLNSGTGTYASFVNGVSSPAIGSGGIGNEIPSCQGFYVHSTGATGLSATETIKVNSNPTFLKTNTQNSSSSSAQLLRLKLKNTTHQDECVVYIETNATIGFDKNYDAYKLGGGDPGAPSIGLENNSLLFQINGIPPINGTYSTNVKVITGTSGNYSISATDFAGFPQGACLKLFDKYSNSTHDLRNGNYSVWLFDSTSTARFILSIELNTLSISATKVNPSCSSANGGYIVALGNSQGPWNYYWKDQTGVLIKSSLNKQGADTLSYLSGGSYRLELSSVGQCDYNETDFKIQSIDIPIASFLCIDTLDLRSNSLVQFANTSVNAINYNWNFGDGTGTSTGQSASYTYAFPGTYTIELFAESKHACKDTAKRQVVVVGKILGTEEMTALPELYLKTLGGNKFLLDSPQSIQHAMEVALIDSQGKTLMHSKVNEHTQLNLEINLSDYSGGIYFLRLYSPSISKVFKLVVQ